MPEQQRLRRSPVSRNLNTKVHVFGLELEDLMAFGIAAAAIMLLGNIILPDVIIMGLPANLFFTLALILVGVPGLMAFKYGKPRGYLPALLRWHLKPRAYCPLTPDTEVTRPYIKSELDSEDE